MIANLQKNKTVCLNSLENKQLAINELTKTIDEQKTITELTKTQKATYGKLCAAETRNKVLEGKIKLLWKRRATKHWCIFAQTRQIVHATGPSSASSPQFLFIENWPKLIKCVVVMRRKKLRSEPTYSSVAEEYHVISEITFYRLRNRR